MSLHCIADREKEAPMSHTSVSIPDPHRRGIFRPHLEVLEARLPPGALSGPPDLPLPTDPWGQEAHRREDADLALLAGLYAAQQQGATVTTSEVRVIAGGTVVGSSTLIRTDNGVTAHLTASGLAPGAYTFWMKVEAPGMGPVAGWLAGHVVGQDGILNFSAHVSVGEVLSRNPDFPSGPLQDPQHATITLVVRSHGKADPGRIYEQTHTFEPGVAVNFLRSIHVPPP
jgi:hypothetical protein